MAFAPVVDATLAIDGATYRFLRHPTAPSVPHGLDGREAIVYQMAGADGRYALKVFKPRYRVPALATRTERLAGLAELPGLRACSRVVLNSTKHTALLRDHPDLTYSLLMPWIDGPTWWDLLMTKRPLGKEQSLAAASGLATVLAALEERGHAHCDLSGANLLLPGLIAPDAKSAVELVDLEQFYGPGLEEPEGVAAGSPGYAHRSGQDSIWNIDKDRFAGSILLAELLCWPSDAARELAFGESLFDPDEIQTDSHRFAVVSDELEALWGPAVSSCFKRAWTSRTLADCPTFAEWVVALPIVGSTPAGSPAKTHDALAVEALMQAGDRFAMRAESAAAFEVYSQAQRMTVPESEMWKVLAQRIEKVGRVRVSTPDGDGPVLTRAAGASSAPPNEARPWSEAVAGDKNRASVAFGAVFVIAAIVLAAVAVVLAPTIESLGKSTVNHWGVSVVWAIGAMLVCTLLGTAQALGFRSRLAPQRRIPYVVVTGMAGAVAGLTAGYVWSSGIVPDERSGAVLGALAGLIASSGHNLIVGGRGGGAKWIVWSTLSSAAIWYLATALTWTADYSVAVALGGGLVTILSGFSHVAFLQFAPEVEF